MAHPSEKRLKIFLSSTASAASKDDPDLRPERDRAEAVLRKLVAELGEFAAFDVVRWEDGYYSAAGGFQDQIVLPSSCDLVVFLFWKRLGSELPPAYDRPDGTSRSGTEFEFEDAIEAALRSERKIPDIFVYKKTAPITYHEQTVDQERADKRALDAFWTRWFQNEKGHFTAAFKTFAKTDDFASLFERDIRQWLESRAADVPWTGESPFPGLAPFGEDHSSVFFGRRRIIDLARARLITAAVGGAAFLLIVGASGSGKSSLVRAGLVPRLIAPGATPTVERFRRLVVTPATLGADPFIGLATAMLADDVLPEIADGDYASPADLGRLFETSAENSAIPIAAALRRVGDKIAQTEGFHERPTTALLLTLDQFEEVLGLSEATQTKFAQLLSALAASRTVWVVATFRSDLYAGLQSTPALLALKEAGQSLDLGPPTAADIGEIIQRPAAAADITYEVSADGSRDLAQLLESEAARPGALPMLAFALRRLYEARDKSARKLLLSTYDDMGGAAGALAEHGDATLARLDVRTKDAFPALIRRLVRVAPGSSAVAATPELARFPEGSPVRQLVDALLEARLLTAFADVDGSAPSRVRVAHEALFEHWPAMRTQIVTDRRDLETLDRTTQALRLWQEAKPAQREARLLTGLALSESDDLLARWNDELDADVRDFVLASTARAVRQRNRSRLAVAAVVAILATFAATTTFFWLRANERTRAAQEQTVQAEEQTRRAERERAASQIAQSQYLTEKATQALQQGDAERATLVALEALPRPGLPRPFVAEALAPLFAAVSQDTTKVALPASGGGVSEGSYSRAGDRIATGTYSQYVYFWDSESGAPVSSFPVASGQARITQLALADDRVAIVSDDDRISVWDLGGKLLREVAYGQPGLRLKIVKLSLDARRASVCTDLGARVIDLESGRDIIDIPPPANEVSAAYGTVARCEMSDSGRYIAAWTVGAKQIRLVDLNGGADRTLPMEADASQIAFSNDDSAIAVLTDTRVLTGRLPGFERLTDIGALSGLSLPVLSPDGERLAVTSNGKAALFEVDGGKLAEWKSGQASRSAFAFYSRDGSTLVGLHTGIDAVLLDAKDLSEGARIAGEFFSPIAAAPNGHDFALPTYGSVITTDFSMPHQSIRVAGHTKPLSTVTMSDDGLKIVTGSWDGSARITDSRSGHEILEVGRNSSNIIDAVLSTDGKRLLTTASDREARLWDAESGQHLRSFPGLKAIFAGDSHVVTHGPDGVVLWNADSGERIVGAPSKENVGGIGASRDGRIVLLWWFDGEVEVLDAATMKAVCAFHNPEGSASGPAALAADGSSFLQRGGLNRLAIVDVRSCAVSKTTDFDVSSPLDRFVLTTARDRLAIPTPSGPIVIIDPATLKEVGRLRDSDGASTATISGDGSRVVARLQDNSFATWDVATGARIASHAPLQASLVNLAYPVVAGDGSHVVLTVPSTAEVGTEDDILLWEIPSIADIMAWSLAAQLRPLEPRERLALFIPVRSLRREWPENPSRCDELGADANDPLRAAPGLASVPTADAPAIVEACRLAYEGDHGSERYRMQLARALHFVGRSDEAIALLEADGGTSYPFGIYLRGSILAAKKDPAKAELARSLLEEASRQGVAGADFRLWGILRGSEDAASKASAMQWLESAARRGDPRAEAQLASMADRAGLAEQDGAKRRAAFIQAFRHWARSAHLAEINDWPQDETKFAMARRGTLARYLVRNGMRPDEVAAIFLDATGITPQQLGLP